MNERQKKYDVETLSKELEDKDPSIIGQTCQMLSALKIASMPSKVAFPFVSSIIEDMKKSGEHLTEEQWNELRVKSLDEYLPKILKDRKWIYSIGKYIKSRLMNIERTEAKKRRNSMPLHPDIQAMDDYKRVEAGVIVHDLCLKAGLTDREINVFYYKKVTDRTGELIARRLGVSESTVEKDYKRAKEKLDKLLETID